MTCKLISMEDIPHDSLVDQPTNLYKIVPEMLLKIEHVDFFPLRCANYAHCSILVCRKLGLFPSRFKSYDSFPQKFSNILFLSNFSNAFGTFFKGI
jgi:hypothetical protein